MSPYRAIPPPPFHCPRCGKQLVAGDVVRCTCGIWVSELDADVVPHTQRLGGRIDVAAIARLRGDIAHVEAEAQTRQAVEARRAAAADSRARGACGRARGGARRVEAPVASLSYDHDMHRLALLLVVACDRATDLATPSAAARCQVAAIAARSEAQWLACWHPDQRAAARGELARRAMKPEFWTRAQAGAAALAGVTDAQFTVDDDRATFRMERDALELVRQDGRWYVVDSGL